MRGFGRGNGRRGVTLIEAVLFISIALGIIVGGLVFFQQASLAQRTQQTVRVVQALRAEADALYRSTGYEFGDLIGPLVAAGAVPSSALTGDPARPVESPWGGAVRFEVLNFTSFGFYMTLEDIPPKICSRIAVYDEHGQGVLGNAIFRMSAKYAGGASANSPRTDVYGDAGAAHRVSDAGSFCDGIEALTIYYKTSDPQ